MPLYTTYGLTIDSQLPMPELPPASAGPADVTLRFGTVTPAPDPALQTMKCYYCNATEACLFWPGTGLASVRNGREIILELQPNVTPDAARAWVLGQALSLLLQQRGLLVLHASAVAIDNRAAIFLGACGMGKSTTAVALHTRGHPLLSDDVIAVDFPDNDEPHVRAAIGQMRLCPDTLRHFSDNPESLPLVHPDEDKRLRPADPGFRGDMRVPVQRIYVLEDAPANAIAPLARQIAFRELLTNTFTARVLNATGAAPMHMDQCARLVSKNMVYSLRRPRDLARLAGLANLIEADMARPGGA